MKKFCLLFLGFLAIFVTQVHQTAAATDDSADFMSFSSGVVLYSPLNTTYFSTFLNLNLTARVGIAINCTITYGIDNKHQGTVPLKEVYPGELHVINQVKGTVALPELTQGTHNLTLQVVCTLNNGQGSATMDSYPFIPECQNITDYHATWTDTIQFTINTPDQQIPEFPTQNILTLAFVVTSVALLCKPKISKLFFKGSHVHAAY